LVYDEPIREDAVARLRSGPREGWIDDPGSDAATAPLIERAMREGIALHDEGRLAFALEGETLPEALSSQRLGSATGAQRWIVDDARLVTLHRQMPRVRDSAVAFLRHLRERGYARAPELLGTATVVDRDGETWVVATSQRYVPHPEDAEHSLRGIFRAGTADERLLRSARVTADALAALHRELATSGSDPTFGTHPMTSDDVARWRAEARADLEALVSAGVEGVVAVSARVASGIDALPPTIEASSSRAHGRLSLHLLVEGGPVFVGFGETVEDRSSPLKDVASLARSFDSVAREAVATSAHDATSDRDATSATVRDLTARALATFVERYAEAARDLETVPQDPEQRAALIRFFRLQSALRDVREAVARRPTALAAAVDALHAECT
jgi:maltose alpha-D-glucosyltransferase/alpha-amylase